MIFDTKTTSSNVLKTKHKKNKLTKVAEQTEANKKNQYYKLSENKNKTKDSIYLSFFPVILHLQKSKTNK